MLPTTFFPTLRMARAVHADLKLEELSGQARLHISQGGRAIGYVADYPAGVPSQAEIAAGDLARFVGAFVNNGYTNPSLDPVPEHLRTNEVVVQRICADLLGERAILKSMKRRAKTHAIWVSREAQPGAYQKFKGAFSEDLKQAIKMSNPAQTILFFINDDIADL